MGQVAQALQNPNTFAPQPSGFNGAEWATRIGGSAMKGLGQGMQNYGQQQRPGGGNSYNAAPFVQGTNIQGPTPTNFTQGAGTGAMGGMPSRRPNPYFYGYGEGQ